MRRAPLGKLLSATAALSLLVFGACGQPEPPADVVEIIGGAQPCTGCRIEMGPPMELRSDGGSAVTMSPTAVSVDGEGRFWVAEVNQLARVYDSNGKFLRTIGQHDGGMTSFGSPVAFMPVPGDSMVVFDFENGAQAFVVDSHFQVARAMRLPDNLLPASASGWPAQMLLSGIVSSATDDAWTLHVATANQPNVTITKSFGTDKLTTEQSTSMVRYQRVAPANDGGFWSADILRYRISHFSNDGVLLGTIERTPDWFPVASNDNFGTPTEPPPPKLITVWQAPDGLLWVFGRVAAKHWQDAWPTLAPGAKEVNFSALSLERMYGTVVEVIDPITRDVITTKTMDEYVSNVLPNGNVVVYSVDVERVAHMAVVRLSLAR